MRRPLSGHGSHTGQVRDQGFTLIETMVALTIFTGLMGLLTTLVIGTIQTSGATRGRTDNTQQLRVAAEEVSKGLRVAARPDQVGLVCTAACAPAFAGAATPTGTDVAFWGNYGDAGKARWVRYFVEADPNSPATARLVEQMSQPMVPAAPPSSCSTGCVQRVLARGLVPAVTVFTYKDRTCTTGVSDPSAIGCVQINLSAAGGRGYSGSSVSSTVFLPNSVIGR